MAKIDNPEEKMKELGLLLVEAWDVMHLVVKEHHIKLHKISPTLVDRIEKALEPWATTEDNPNGKYPPL